ncbi:hypothetical protein ANN_06929 [Periplaneta americana]|uniref:Mariner Mos1 transposase n=1 Tax=Periplaneta americana TaxID=6978 RepID=A0ABQ8TGW7_PERAM|nr:hypothetical protein ANN_06929 [Periplaneta americana]
MKFPMFNKGTAMQSHRPCWTGTKGKMTTFLDESLLWSKPGLAHTNQPNLKRQSNEWKHPGSSRPKKVRSTQSAVKVMFIAAYDIDGVILHHAVPPRQTAKADYYCRFLQHHLRPALRRKRRHLVVQNPIILHDNAMSHTAGAVKDLLCHWQWEILEQPQYSPDMSPCDYDLFTKVKEPRRGTRYNTRDELISAIGQSIRNIKKDGRLDGVRCLPNIWQKNMGLGNKKDVEFAIANRVNRLFSKAIKRFPSDVRIWISYIKFCKQMLPIRQWFGILTANTRVVGRTLAQMMQVHSDKPNLWSFAAKWEFEENHSVENARQFLLRGLCFHPESKVLYNEDPVQANRGNYFNERWEASRTLRNKKRDYLKEKLNGVETKSIPFARKRKQDNKKAEGGDENATGEDNNTGTDIDAQGTSGQSDTQQQTGNDIQDKILKFNKEEVDDDDDDDDDDNDY